MKRYFTGVFFAIILLAVCIIQTACAESTLPDRQFLDNAKQAVVFIHQKDYQNAAKMLGRTDINDIRRVCEESCPELFKTTPQNEISVTYAILTGIYIAVPISIPSSNDCKTIVFALSDNFDILSARVVAWMKVTEEFSSADNVMWNVEYIPGYSSLTD